MCEVGMSESRDEAVAIGQRLVEFGLIDHVNSVFRHVEVVVVTVCLVETVQFRCCCCTLFQLLFLGAFSFLVCYLAP